MPSLRPLVKGRCGHCGGRMYREEPDYYVRKPDIVCLNCARRVPGLAPLEPALELRLRQPSHEGRIV